MTVWAVSEEIESISSACNSAWVIMIPFGVVFTFLLKKNYFQFLGTLQVVLEPSLNTERLMDAPGIHAKKIKYDKYFFVTNRKFYCY